MQAECFRPKEAGKRRDMGKTAHYAPRARTRRQTYRVQAMSRVRLVTPNFWKTAASWFFTVATDRPRAAAISLLLSPRRTRASTSRSEADSAARRWSTTSQEAGGGARETIGKAKAAKKRR